VPGGLLAALDYLVPLGLLDTPLAFGWGLTGMGMGMHVEVLADFDAGAARFAVLPDLFAGLDITLRMSFGSSYVPVGIGVAAALRASGAFDPSRDLGLYLFVGFDSFTDAAAPRAAPRPWRGALRRGE
jgi:hypothetical protein